MIALLKREIRSFFNTLTGYLVIIVFLIVNSLFLWIFPGELNILDSGYATLDTLFIIAPWVFLFLVPAITMRMFSEEKKAGTLELLLTRPVTDMEIVVSKFFAGVILVLFSIVPTLIFYVSVYLLGNPIGNIDSGATWGSFIGLFFLAIIYVSIGIFSSSFTENQMISFIIAVVLSFTLFIGFESLGSLFESGSSGTLLMNIGINEHYKSIRKGVIDSRDVVYFLSVTFIFLFLTRTKLQSRKW